MAVAYGQSLDNNLEARFCILSIGVVLTSVMLISLIKHRFFQHGSEQQIWRLQIRLNIKDWYRSPRIHRPRHLGLWPRTRIEEINVKLKNWVWRRSGFNWMLGGYLVVMAILVILATITFGQLILPILKLATITYGQLILLILRLILN